VSRSAKSRVDDTVHSRSDKIEKLSAMDFGPKSNVEEGAG